MSIMKESFEYFSSTLYNSFVMRILVENLQTVVFVTMSMCYVSICLFKNLVFPFLEQTQNDGQH